MRIVRFRTDDGPVLGEDHADGSATVLLDARGVLGPKQGKQAARELLRGKCALVADDDEGIRQAVCGTLRKLDCECLICADGEEALRALDVGEPDLVVSDISMPHHDGYEVFAAAKSRSATLPVVLITGFGYDPGHVVVRACDEGVEGVLYKPFTPQQLVDKITEAVQGTTRNGCPSSLVRTDERMRCRNPLAPLEPHDILCVGTNYATVSATNADDVDLELFMKPRSALIGPQAPIRIPALDDPCVDCEGELAIVIGRGGRDIAEADALEHVLGFTAANDITARRWQSAKGPGAWMRGKGFDTFCPVGPAIVTPDEIADVDDLEITTRINGSVVRHGRTSSMLRSVSQLIHLVSRHMTLHDGTLLLTGAPPPVEVDRDRPISLKPGDEVSVDIEGIGRLVNPIAEA